MPYTPDELAAQLVDGAGLVGPWVAAGVAGALVLFFLFLGIRAAFRFFNDLVGGGGGAHSMGNDAFSTSGNSMQAAENRAYEAGMRGDD